MSEDNEPKIAVHPRYVRLGEALIALEALPIHECGGAAGASIAVRDFEVSALKAKLAEAERERDEAIRVMRTDDVVNVRAEAAEARVAALETEVWKYRTLMIPFASLAEMLRGAAWPSIDFRWQALESASIQLHALLAPAERHPEPEQPKCATCGGTGLVMVTMDKATGERAGQECPDCRPKCATCGGSGHTDNCWSDADTPCLEPCCPDCRGGA